MMLSGISIIICCHNSIKRLQPTLQHLLEQDNPKRIPWEVLLIDNLSTDGTSEYAKDFWPNNAPANLQVVSEARLGLVFARQRGFEEAHYDIVSFIDDDNWVAPNWINRIYAIMVDHPNVGACGGKIEAVCEIDPPAWFDIHKGKYAVGKQSETSSDVTWTRSFLWGAGLTIRKSAWNSLVMNGFKPILTGRIGKHLSAGEDSEICLALQLAGWRLWYEEDLSLLHFIPSERLKFAYLKKLMYGFGASSIILSCYTLAHTKDIEAIKGRTGTFWIWQLRACLSRTVELAIKNGKQKSEEDELNLQWALGALHEIIHINRLLDKYTLNLYNAKWNITKNRF